MKIKQLFLENFRTYKNKINIDFDNLTTFIAKNDVGKSSILEALEIFFNNKIVKIEPDDLSKGLAETEEITIGVSFSDFEDEIVIDSTAETSLKDEFLLNSEGLLEVQKKYSKGKLTKTYIVANYPKNNGVADILNLKIAELRARAGELGVNSSTYVGNTSSSIRKAIFEHLRGSLEFEQQMIAIDQTGTKEIWNQIEKYFPIYALFQSDRKNQDKDGEVQEPMKFAIKQLLKEEDIQRLLESVEEKVIGTANEIAKATIEKLSEMSPEIAKELSPKFDKPSWDSIFKPEIESDDGVPLNKRGSGVRRLVLLNFFRAEADRQKELKRVPNIVYAIEEPETSQHPDYQKMLIEALIKLSTDSSTQVVLTTHSPAIAKLLPTDTLHLITREGGENKIFNNKENIYEQIAESLGLLPEVDQDKVNSLRMFICVEGPTDCNFMEHVDSILEANEKVDIVGNGSLIIIPLGGGTLKHWVDNHYLRKLSKPEIHVYDKYPTVYQDRAAEVTSRGDGSKGFITNKKEIENYVHPSVLESYFSLPSNSLVDRTQPDWLVEWDEKDIFLAIRQAGVVLNKRTIKKKIAEDCFPQITRQHLEELGAIDEIISWFNEIKGLIS